MLLIVEHYMFHDFTCNYFFVYLQQISKANDVSQFFPDVVKLTARKNFELKRFVYIYLTHYAVGHPKARLFGRQVHY